MKREPHLSATTPFFVDVEDVAQPLLMLGDVGTAISVL